MMGRLIDADKCPCVVCEDTRSAHCTYEHRSCKKFCDWLNNTAYDTERVIEQLNDLPTFKVSETSEKHPFCAYEAEMISKHKVMGIVKKGDAE